MTVTRKGARRGVVKRRRRHAASQPTPALSPWTDAERAAWRLPEDITAAKWAEKYRQLGAEQSSRPGPWRNANAPHVIGILSLLTWRYVSEVAVIKAGQTSVSEALRCWLGYVAATDPAPFLYVMPDEKTGRRQIEKHYFSLFRDTPPLAELLSARLHDTKLSSVALRNGFRMDLAFAKSTAQMKSDPYCYAAVDEAAECPAKTIEKVRVRLTTYGDRSKLAIVSTPKDGGGQIVKAFDESAVKLYLYCPCPHCGKYQKLDFARIGWEGKSGAMEGEDKPATEDDDAAGGTQELTAQQRAAYIQHTGAAWYECAHCEAHITSRQKPVMLRRAVWVTDELGGELVAENARSQGAATPDGYVIPFGDALPAGEKQRRAYVAAHWPPGRTVGLRFWKAYAIETTWAQIAVAALRAAGDEAEQAEFHEQWLGEVYYPEIATPEPDVFEAKCQVPWPEGVLPNWAVCVTATVDVHDSAKGFYILFRAWAAGAMLRSRRVAHQVFRGTFTELYAFVMGQQFVYEDAQLGALGVQLIAIDRSWRTPEVNDLAARHPGRVYALEPQAEIRRTTKSRDISVSERLLDMRRERVKTTGRPVAYYRFNANEAKNWVARAVRTEIEVSDAKTGEIDLVAQWELNSRNDPDYNRQMCAEPRVIERRANGRYVEVWGKRTGDNHWWDCEQYQCVAAYLAKVPTLKGRVQAIRPTYAARGDRIESRSSGWKIGR